MFHLSCIPLEPGEEAVDGINTCSVTVAIYKRQSVVLKPVRKVGLLTQEDLQDLKAVII